MQGLVGATDQRRQVVVRLQRGDADAQGHQQQFALHRQVVLGGLSAQLLGDLPGMVQVGLAQQQQELLSSPAADDVGAAQTAAQALGEGLQRLVAGVVAVAVIEPLELVEVDQQRAQRALLALGVLQRLPGQQVEAAAVGQSGELVGHGQRADPRLVAAHQQSHGAQYQGRHQQPDDQAQVERFAQRLEYAAIRLVDEQIPVQFRDETDVEEAVLQLQASLQLLATRHRQLLQHAGKTIEIGQRLATVRALRAAL